MTDISERTPLLPAAADARRRSAGALLTAGIIALLAVAAIVCVGGGAAVHVHDLRDARAPASLSASRMGAALGCVHTADGDPAI